MLFSSTVDLTSIPLTSTMTIVRFSSVPLAFAAFFALCPMLLVNGFSLPSTNNKQFSSSSRMTALMVTQNNDYDNGVSSRRQVLNLGLSSLVFLSTINPEMALAEDAEAAVDDKKPPTPASSAPAKKKRFAKTATKRSAPKSEDGESKNSMAGKAANFILGQ